jgi:type I restriction enzyme S subunit
MTAQQLKNSILQMAVQGKLVPQDPNDEPASVLLERIRAEKERLIKEKKIKREKNPSVIFKGADNTPYEKIGDEVRPLADEVPFDIPDSWEWCRFSSLITLLSGTSYQKNDVCNSGIRILRGGNIQSYKLILEDSDVFLPLEYRDEEKNIQPGDTILVASTGSKSVIGKPAFVDKEYPNTQIGAFLRIARPIDPIIADYIALIFETEYYREHIRHSVQGTNINNIKAEYIENLLIPLPPHEEQVRVLAKLSGLEPALVQYDNVENTLQSLNASFPEALKKSILQEAVQGKLVPQDPSDEPAEALLERIRAEKQRLIKEGKIKKDKHESIIFRRDNSHYEKRGSEEVCIDDEIPFEVPSSWALIRLDDIGIYRKGPFGSSLTKSMFVPKGADTVKVYEQKNAIQKDHTLGTYYITHQYYESKMKGFTVQPGDILVSCAGTIGETYVLPDQIELGIINQALMRMTIFAPINLDYFLLYFDYVLKQTAKESSKGSAIKNIPPFEIFKKLILPLPPLEEQKRIVEKVRELENLCNSLYA